MAFVERFYPFEDFLNDAIRKQETRTLELMACESEEARERLKDRWSQEDSAEKIADAIRSAGRNQRRGFFF